MINKELMIKILKESNIGLYYKSSPLEEFPTNVGTMYKINEVGIDSLHEAVMKEIENERQSDKWENNNSSQNLEKSTE